MAVYRDSELECVFAYNPTLGNEDTEAEKILYFYPKMSLDMQKTFVGLSEGLMNFVRDFSPTPCDSLHCEKHRYALYKCEEDHWLVLVVKNPRVEDSKGNATEWKEDELEDSVLQAIIRHAYSTFKFFNGTMASIAEREGSQDALRQSLRVFFKHYLRTIRFNQLRFFTDINGFRFFPVDKHTYLTIQYLSNTITSRFPELSNMCVMYDAKLIWSGLEQSDMRVLYNLDQDNMARVLYQYLIQYQKEHKPVKNNRKVDLKNYEGEFLTGPLRHGNHADFAPRVYLTASHGNTPTEQEKHIFHRLIVFKFHRLSLFFILREDPTQPDPSATRRPTLSLSWGSQMYTKLQQFLLPHVKQLHATLHQQGQRLAGQQEPFRFLYFNHRNLALKTSLTGSAASGAPLTVDTIQILRQIHVDFEKDDNVASEVCVQASSDGSASTGWQGWVVGKKSKQTQREFYVLIDERKVSSLASLQAEIDELERVYFANILTV